MFYIWVSVIKLTLNILKMAIETKQSNLSIAFDNVRSLNLDLTTDQFIQLNEILYQLANEQHLKGMDDAKTIYNNFRY